jgi:hypothetical protein
MDAYRFIDLEDGDEVSFHVIADSVGFIWNNQYQFFKIK